MKFSPASLALIALALITSSSKSHAQAIGKTPVDVTLFVMSRCPDAMMCERTFETVFKIEDLPPVNPLLSYIATINKMTNSTSSSLASTTTTTVTCKHGPLECAGNIQQLCFKRYFPNYRVWFPFVAAMNSWEPQRIGEPEYARKVAHRVVGTGHGALLHQVEACANGQEGLDMLIESAQNTIDYGISTSCTVFINNKKRCVVDGGIWRDCPGGHSIADFVQSIIDAASSVRHRLKDEICKGVAAMSHPRDDDFDFEDIDALELELNLDDQPLRIGADKRITQIQRNPPMISHRDQPSNNAGSSSNSNNKKISDFFSCQPSNASASAASKDAIDEGEFEDFGELDDAALLMDDNDLLDDFDTTPTSAARSTSSSYFAAPQNAQPPFQQPQQRPSPAQPAKLFSIFGGNNNPPPTRGNSPPLSRGNSFQQPRSINSISNGITNPATSPNIISRSDPMNDFAVDIFKSPESVGMPSQPSTHHEIDLEAVRTWQYPINYPKRDYQYNIIRRALFTNTLVSLPTGLGKTFIAAVVMLNYFRWFPKSKLIFMAPTRPLVNQQIQACFNICGIPQDETIEMTGQQNAELRRELWKRKRVVFCTPQIAQNDIKSGICPADEIVCLIVDEAHRATGRHAYSEVVRLLDPLNRDIRVMALTATPGTDIKAVQQVIKNLKIAKIEMRIEDSMDLQRYVFKRTVQEMVVPCGREVGEIRDKFVRLMRPFLDRLAKQNILRTADPTQLSRFVILSGRDSYLRSNPQYSANKSFIMKQVGICMGLVHAYELLTIHGIRPFFANMDPFAGASSNNQDSVGMMRSLSSMSSSSSSTGGSRKGVGVKRKQDDNDDLGVENDMKPSLARKAMSDIPEFMRMMDSIRNKMKQPSFVSHPKLERLVGVVVQHFVNHQDESDAQLNARAESSGSAASSASGASSTSNEPQQTRVMIFANYRESVEEIARVLEQHRPLIKVQSFIGQATAKGKKGISQKEQQKVVADFQKGEHNVLVATSIGEEGLDIGDVDLIVCYDSHSSPIRMLQRMGRTGRKRKGKICLLLAEGPEESKYRRAQTQYKSVQRAISQGNIIQYYPHSPRILPAGSPPVCDLIHIHVPTYVKPLSARKRLRLEDDEGVATRPRTIQSAYLDPQELARFQQKYLIPRREVRLITFQRACSKLLQNRKRSALTADTTYQVGHSTRTLDFINTVNQLAKARVEQSLAGLSERNPDGMDDPYSKRMHALLEQSGPSGIAIGDTDSSVATGKPLRGHRLRGFIEDPQDQENSHDEDLFETLFGGVSNAEPSIRPKPKQQEPKPRRKTTKAKDSLIATKSPLISTTSLFDTISDDEVDLEIMGGLGGEFTSAVAVKDPFRQSSPGDDHIPSLTTWNPHRSIDHRSTVSRRKEFDFKESLTPPPLWYRPETDDEMEDERNHRRHKGKDRADDDNDGKVVVFTLPPLPEPGEWYVPADMERTTTSGFVSAKTLISNDSRINQGDQTDKSASKVKSSTYEDRGDSIDMPIAVEDSLDYDRDEFQDDEYFSW
ncbi:hypothetical protein BG011_001752 [Mortierella polycephala]|uniref:ATP-dependent DNA helicase n=1 Tax=Mortierella polycephala TaxID=41804 RepID=A0A9P6Q4U3_9FUNG|nr:hypothetical protein BG011_001752 [Mortierella polycephala]